MPTAVAIGGNLRVLDPAFWYGAIEIRNFYSGSRDGARICDQLVQTWFACLGTFRLRKKSTRGKAANVSRWRAGTLTDLLNSARIRAKLGPRGPRNGYESRGLAQFPEKICRPALSGPA